jgi:hypothetical protein
MQIYADIDVVCGPELVIRYGTAEPTAGIVVFAVHG